MRARSRKAKDVRSEPLSDIGQAGGKKKEEKGKGYGCDKEQSQK